MPRKPESGLRGRFLNVNIVNFRLVTLVFGVAFLTFSCSKDEVSETDISSYSSEEERKSAGGCEWVKLVQRPNSNWPNCGRFYNERECGTCGGLPIFWPNQK